MTTNELRELQEWRRRFANERGEPMTPEAARAEYDRFADRALSKMQFAIVVEGGVVQDCFCPVPFEYEVFDYDDLQETMTGDEATRYVTRELARYNPEGGA